MKCCVCGEMIYHGDTFQQVVEGVLRLKEGIPNKFGQETKQAIQTRCFTRTYCQEHKLKKDLKGDVKK